MAPGSSSGLGGVRSKKATMASAGTLWPIVERNARVGGPFTVKFPHFANTIFLPAKQKRRAIDIVGAFGVDGIGEHPIAVRSELHVLAFGVVPHERAHTGFSPGGYRCTPCN